MNFFETLRERAMAACGYAEWEPHYKAGINATIEALKEMVPENLTEELLERKCKKCFFQIKAL